MQSLATPPPLGARLCRAPSRTAVRRIDKPRRRPIRQSKASSNSCTNPSTRRRDMRGREGAAVPRARCRARCARRASWPRSTSRSISSASARRSAASSSVDGEARSSSARSPSSSTGSTVPSTARRGQEGATVSRVRRRPLRRVQGQSSKASRKRERRDIAAVVGTPHYSGGRAVPQGGVERPHAAEHPAGAARRRGRRARRSPRRLAGCRPRSGSAAR